MATTFGQLWRGVGLMLDIKPLNYLGWSHLGVRMGESTGRLRGIKTALRNIGQVLLFNYSLCLICSWTRWIVHWRHSLEASPSWLNRLSIKWWNKWRQATKILPVRLITSGQDSCTEARSDSNINTNSAICQNNFLQFSLCISQFCACRKCCTDSAVNATAVSIDLRPGWLSSIDKAGLTTQPLPGVWRDMVGCISTRSKYLEVVFSLFKPTSLHHLPSISSPRSRHHCSRVTSISGACLRIGGITFYREHGSHLWPQLQPPSCNHLAHPAPFWGSPPGLGSGHPLAGQGQVVPTFCCPTQVWNVSGHLLNTQRYLWSIQSSRIPIRIWLQSCNYINNGWVDLHRSEAATSSALDF